MKLIKLFEQYVKEEVEMDRKKPTQVGHILSKLTVPFEFDAKSALMDLNNESTEFNTTIGFDAPPRNFSGMHKTAYVLPNDVDSFIDALDDPMSSDDPKHVKQWLQGNGFPGIFGGSGNYGALKDRVVHHTDGLWYPAVEDLRVKYNLDESFETLGSAVSKPELAEAKKLLLECYEFWFSSVNSEIMLNSKNKYQDFLNSDEFNLVREKQIQQQYIQEEVEAVVPVTPIGKKELIEVLKNHINRIEKNNDWTSMEVAQVVYNDCANFMNKEGMFSDKTKYGDIVSQPAAQFAPVAVPQPGMEDTMDNSIVPALRTEANPQLMPNTYKEGDVVTDL